MSRTRKWSRKMARNKYYKMSQVLYDNDNANAVAIPRVSSENSRAKNGSEGRSFCKKVKNRLKSFPVGGHFVGSVKSPETRGSFLAK